MGWTCGSHGRKKNCVQNFWRENWKEGDYFEGLGVDRRVILKYILKETGLEVANSIQETQDMAKLWAVLYVAMNVLFQRNAEYILTE